jgi:prolipoprotein diacylglyceryltransferase
MIPTYCIFSPSQNERPTRAKELIPFVSELEPVTISEREFNGMAAWMAGHCIIGPRVYVFLLYDETAFARLVWDA